MATLTNAEVTYVLTAVLAPFGDTAISLILGRVLFLTKLDSSLFHTCEKGLAGCLEHKAAVANQKHQEPLQLELLIKDSS